MPGKTRIAGRKKDRIKRVFMDCRDHTGVDCFTAMNQTNPRLCAEIRTHLIRLGEEWRYETIIMTLCPMTYTYFTPQEACDEFSQKFGIHDTTFLGTVFDFFLRTYD
jgi:hypothetical protein